MKQKSRNEKPRLSVQERALAHGALEGIGNVATAYSLIGGNRVYTDTLPVDELPERLVDQFKNNPKDALAFMRQNLIAVGADRRLSESERKLRLERYILAYTELTLKLDHAAFPPDDVVRKGVPDYIPDGFIDMGGYANPDPMRRDGRDQIRVDKRSIYDKHHDFLLKVFSQDWSGVDSTTQKRMIADTLLQRIYFSMPYDSDLADGTSDVGGVVNLHEMEKGVCRHLSLNYQVLAQACGLTSRYIKCRVDGERHAANAVRINYDWRLVDPTIPDYYQREDGANEWRPGTYRIDSEPKPGDRLTVTGRHNNIERVYTIRDDMFWRISA